MKILVIRFKQIGDSILASSICNSLKKTFPDSKIDYVLYEHVSPLFKHDKYIDNAITIINEERKNPFKYLFKVFKITRKKYDIVIDIMSTPKSELFTLFSLRAKYRIGRFKKYRGYTYTNKVKESKNAKDKVDKFLAMLKPLEKDFNIKYDPSYSINVTGEEKLYMKEKMIAAGINFSKPIFACAINSRVPRKIYPIDNMIQVIQTLIDTLDIQIIFYYSPDEKKFANKTHRKLNNNKNIFSNIETSSIRELAMLLSNCDLFFGNEGDPRHLAQALDIPSFAVFSPESSKKEWLANKNERHSRVEPQDFKIQENMTRDEIYRLITPEYIENEVTKLYNKFVK